MELEVSAGSLDRQSAKGHKHPAECVAGVDDGPEAESDHEHAGQKRGPRGASVHETRRNLGVLTPRDTPPKISKIIREDRDQKKWKVVGDPHDGDDADHGDRHGPEEEAAQPCMPAASLTGQGGSEAGDERDGAPARVKGHEE